MMNAHRRQTGESSPGIDSFLPDETTWIWEVEKVDDQLIYWLFHTQVSVPYPLLINKGILRVNGGYPSRPSSYFLSYASLNHSLSIARWYLVTFQESKSRSPKTNVQMSIKHHCPLPRCILTCHRPAGKKNAWVLSHLGSSRCGMCLVVSIAISFNYTFTGKAVRIWLYDRSNF